MTLDHSGYLSSPIPDWLHLVIKLGTCPTTRASGSSPRAGSLCNSRMKSASYCIHLSFKQKTADCDMHSH